MKPQVGDIYIHGLQEIIITKVGSRSFYAKLNKPFIFTANKTYEVGTTWYQGSMFTALDAWTKVNKKKAHLPTWW